MDFVLIALELKFLGQMNKVIIPEEKVVQRIFLLREEKVILDSHLAEFYHVETRILKQAVKRNRERFPEDFLFILNKSETEMLIEQGLIDSHQKLGGASPYAFTESGVAMLASVLKSPMAISTSIGIIRTFTQLRKMSLNYEDLKNRLDNLEEEYGRQFSLVFKALEAMHHEKQSRKKIGY